MVTSTYKRRRDSRTTEVRVAGTKAFWNFAECRLELNEADRLQQIRRGLPAYLTRAIRYTFDLDDGELALLLNASILTLQRRVRENQALDMVASERLDRLALLSHQAEGVFEDRDAAAIWLSKRNKALDDNKPVLLCETEIGARQVRRVLQSLDWGEVA
ncbi:antitoxin Xre/MbcA/ParS toxin-binding domain-containing protein [Schauerella aestuarii]|uniref:antitoxin Xre/MbcA/ParS toxin-binding domain-containing protein n=1 Tax=Schauerella aestuarii TaxID=2511204 RepID=UPI00136F8F82|nr:antitoxin Xre/MbcA/ParS toxin-binding domain-containing protein [Achromobacter aestuarii]MYZ42539.1 DUF2384 domain-containing protein [Achromobacter aestuarii]